MRWAPSGAGGRERIRLARPVARLSPARAQPVRGSVVRTPLFHEATHQKRVVPDGGDGEAHFLLGSASTEVHILSGVPESSESMASNTFSAPRAPVHGVHGGEEPQAKAVGLVPLVTGHRSEVRPQRWVQLPRGFPGAWEKALSRHRRRALVRPALSGPRRGWPRRRTSTSPPYLVVASRLSALSCSRTSFWALAREAVLASVAEGVDRRPKARPTVPGPRRADPRRRGWHGPRAGVPCWSVTRGCFISGSHCREPSAC